jgi:spore cortex formation protein SpoVR/YcgB (stage V sporulation)
MTFKTPALIFSTLAAPTLAFAGLSLGDQLGTEEAKILAALEAEGYVIQETEAEEGEFEVEALLDGVLYEIEIDLNTGEVVEVELEDDDDDDDDDDDA